MGVEVCKSVCNDGFYSIVSSIRLLCCITLIIPSCGGVESVDRVLCIVRVSTWEGKEKQHNTTEGGHSSDSTQSRPVVDPAQPAAVARGVWDRIEGEWLELMGHTGQFGLLSGKTRSLTSSGPLCSGCDHLPLHASLQPAIIMTRQAYHRDQRPPIAWVGVYCGPEGL
jgi:hypothetical protein